MDRLLTLLVLYFVHCSAPLTGQSVSLDKILHEKNDSIKCELLLESSDYYKYHNVDTLLLIADELYHSAEKLKSIRFLESAYNLKSLALKFKGQFQAAIEYAQKALELNNQRKDNIARAKILLNYADLMRQQKQFDVSKRYHHEGIQHSKSERDSSLLARFYINTALMFSDLGSLDSAIYYYTQGILITDKLPDLKNIGITARLNMSNLAFQQGKYNEMIGLAMQVYEYAESNNDPDHLSLGATNVALGYLKLKNYEKALEYIHHAEEAARKYKSPHNLLLALGNASDIYAEKGDFLSAYNKALAYIGLKDSLRTALYDQNLMEITTKYELKEKQNLLNQHQLTIQKQSSRQRMTLWISGLLILTLILIFFYLKSRQELQRKTAEVEAEKAQLLAQIQHAEVERMQQLEDLRSNFFANISHEFRTPLTLILNPVDKLINTIRNTEQQQHLHLIRGNASRLLELVNQLLELSKLEGGKESLKIGKYDLKQFCLGVAGMFESIGHQKGIPFTIDVPKDELMGYFDRDKLYKILTNLLSNAFKFTSSGDTIQFTLTNSSPYAVCISVRDTGIGISKENQSKLFERFMSFAGSDIQKSSGIGLSLVKELVQLHKGTIEVESEVDRGSVFTVHIPIGKDHYVSEITNEKTDESIVEDEFIYGTLNTDNIPKTKKAGSIDLFNESKPLLLIAEDNPDVRFLIADACKPHFKVITAENGISALEMATEKIPDIIITDVMMPGMDGMDLCKELRGHDLTSHIPIIMLTARGDQQAKLTGLKTGADAYLTKPFDDEELIVRLQSLLTQRRKLQEHYKKVLHAFAPADVSVTSMDDAFLHNLKNKIENSIHKENYGVSELATAMALSRSQLHRKVTGLLGLAPNEIIRNMRLEKARLLIRKQSGSIAEIAYQCGFSSPAYFAKCYKEYFGHTAGEE